MENKELHYDAFISYRHCELDKFVAENLHKSLETFTLPANVKRKILAENPEANTKISRVFRDQEELPISSNLADPIVTALENSDWLIVICSPRLKDSMWCQKEIETFIALHGRDRVMAVLIEGEPRDSFPEILTYKEVEVKKADGSIDIVKEPIEPLAADVRGADNKEVLKAIKAETIRLAAPIFGLSYDELKQRHRERKLKRIITLVSIVAAVCFAFGILSTYSALTIKRQSVEIQNQATEIAAQADEISQQNNELRVGQAKNLAEKSLELYMADDRFAAIEMASDAITEYEGIEMPYTDEARYALFKSVNPYDIAGSQRAKYQIEADGIVKFMLLSPKKETLMVLDESGEFIFWSVNEEKELARLATGNEYISDENVIFKDDDTFIYTDFAKLYAYTISTGDSVEIYDGGLGLIHGRVRLDYSTNIVYLLTNDGIEGFDCDKDYKKCFEYKCPEGENLQDNFRYVQNSNIVAVTKKKGESTVDAVETVRVINPEGEEIFEVSLEGDHYTNAYAVGDKLFVLTSHMNTTGEDTSALASNSSIVKTYSISSGAKLWEREDIGLYADKLAPIQESDGDYIVEVGDRGIVELNQEDGHAALVSYQKGNIKWVGATGTSVILVTDTPTKLYLSSHTTMGMSDEILCNLKSIAAIEMALEGYFIQENNSNRVVYYTSLATDNFDDYTGKVKVQGKDDIVDNSNDLQDVDFSKWGVEKEYLVKNYIFDDEEKLVCITGKDRKAYIYDVDEKEEIASFDLHHNYEAINQYLGMDEEGNRYWASDKNGYCLSKDNILIAEYDYLRAIDSDKNLLIFGLLGGDELYSAPMYSVDEMLDLGKKISK